MSRKTNKTTHVLNLLSNGVKKQEESDAKENKEKVIQETESAAASQQKQETEEKGETPGVSVVHRGKDAVADLIKESLEEELQTADRQEAKEEPEDEVGAAEDRKGIGEAGKDQTAGQESGTDKPAEAPAEEEPEDEFVTVNVMEKLVKERAPSYIRQFHICGCRRCLADVTALALTGLPAKYVVINKNAVSPLMNFYTVKYAGLITVEVTKACLTVQAKPHHNTEKADKKDE